mmetsp:Transcript_19586/g.28373  ORF Transcript_19586/g.28373 Transcript_19586/m.28373 type:complete len:520 (-) Transcript_19586:380-1939(-)
MMRRNTKTEAESNMGNTPVDKTSPSKLRQRTTGPTPPETPDATPTNSPPRSVQGAVASFLPTTDNIISSFLMGPHSFESMPMQVNVGPASNCTSRPTRKCSDSEGLVIGTDDEVDTDNTIVSDIENLYTNESSTMSSALRKRDIAPLLAGTEMDSTENEEFDNSYIDMHRAKPSGSFYGRFRSREQIIIHFLLELRMLRVDLAFIFLMVCFQAFHNAMTNLAYYYHTKLSAAQRVPLADMLFDVLPVFNGAWWMISEYIMLAFIAIIAVSIVSILGVRWNAPHGRPMYCISIIRRMLMTLVSCQFLRIVSFMITTLPGPSRQCLYHVPKDLTAEEMTEGPAPDAGNPSGWNAPSTWNDIIFRLDSTTGCGDLMFSSHTIFTMVFVCVIFKYFNWTFMKRVMIFLQITIVPFIVASHKHYSVDVFTALYVTPLVFEILWTRFPDKDLSSTDLANHYGIRFYLTQTASGDGYAYVVNVWGREFYVEMDDLPVDLNYKRTDKMDSGTKRLRPSSAEVSPLIV